MLELLKTLYVFQSLDLALFFFKGAGCVGSGVARGWGWGWGWDRGETGGESYQTLDCFCVHPSLRWPPPTSAKMAFYRLSMLLLPVKGYFLLMKRIRRLG